jgi:hypothetical protein
MKKIKIAAILLITSASFTACQKESLVQPVELDATESTELNTAAKAAKKPYISTITDDNGNILQQFFYNSSAVLTDIRFSTYGGIMQHFNYSSTGQLSSIDFIDNSGVVTEYLTYTYGANPDLPQLAQKYVIDNAGFYKLQSEVTFQWNNKGQKTDEYTNMIATGVITRQHYTYSNGNLISNELYESGILQGSVEYSQFDAFKSPFKNNSMLKLLPGFEFQNHNMTLIKSDRGGISMLEKATITYNASKFPTEIITNSSVGVTKHLFYSYVKK